MALVAKRMDPDKRLAAQKKISAATSIAGGTTGLTALGLLATRRPKNVERAAKLTTIGAGIGGLGAYNYASIQNQEAKKKKPHQNVYVVRNKKQIKNIKSGLEPVTKGAHTMDFGLGDVHQGEPISKAQKQKTPGQENAGLAGAAITPAAGFVGARAAKGAQAGYGIGRLTGSGKVASAKTGVKMVKPAVQGAVKAPTLLGAAMRNPIKTTALAVAGSVGGEKAYGALKPVKPKGPVKPKQTIGKASDWMNISEHERRSRDSRRTARRGESAAGWGGTAILGSVAHRNLTNTGRKYATVDQQLANTGKNITRGKLVYAGNKSIGRSTSESLKATAKFAGSAAKANPHATGVIGGGALLAGGLATKVGARANEKKHDRAIAAQRRQRVGKAFGFKPKYVTHHFNPELGTQVRQVHGAKTPFTNRSLKATSWRNSSTAGAVDVKSYSHRTTLNRKGKIAAGVTGATAVGGGGATAYKKVEKSLVFKAYNPEDKRQKRLDNAATGMSVGAGASAAGAGYYGKKSIGTKPYDRPVKAGPKMAGGVVHNAGTGLRSEVTGSFGSFRGKKSTPSGFKGGLRTAGKAGALGLTAVGLAVGSDRVRSYRRGNGGSYRQLHRGS